MREKDVERFSRWGPEYEESRLQSNYYRPVHLAVLDLVTALEPQPSCLLDVGRGTGAFLRRAASRFPECQLYGADPAPGMVEAAQRYSSDDERMHFAMAPAQNLPFPDAHFDVALSTVSFHHWGNQAKGLSEVNRVLRPAGFLVLADMLAVSYLRPLFFLSRDRDRFHTRSELEAMLSAARLDTLSWTHVRHQSHLPSLWAVSARKPAT